MVSAHVWRVNTSILAVNGNILLLNKPLTPVSADKCCCTVPAVFYRVMYTIFNVVFLSSSVFIHSPIVRLPGDIAKKPKQQF
jgi:hypothetical protein